MSNTKKIMCKYNLYNKEDTKRWILVNHPDKKDHPQHNPNISLDEYKKVVKCYKDNIYCSGPQKKIRVTKNNRNKIFRCMRKTANFSKIANYHKFDKNVFNSKKFLEDLDEASPKIIQLINTITQLDEEDKKNHNKNFKHFIFSDVKEGGYGAKIIASALIAFGFNNVIKARKVQNVKKLKLYIETHNSKNNFGLLCSNSIYGSTFNEKLKKELLNLFNKRPDNINGEKLRFIIFDSGFKEGIDLFDVKYVHIFEPSMTIADLKQTVGRATRTCGQKGLKFLPGIGWPLYVYNYYLTVPDIMANSMTASKFLINNITKSRDEKDEDILIFKNIDKFNDTTMMYTNFDKAMDNLSKQLFELAPSLSTDFILTKNLHNVDDLNHDYMEKDFYLMGGAKNILNNVNKNSKYFNINFINCKGNCGQKTSNDVPVSVDFLQKVYYKYSHNRKLIPSKNKREFFCDYMSNSANASIYCKQLNYEWSKRYSIVPNAIEKNKDLDSIELEKGEKEEIKSDYNNLDYSGTNINKIKSNKMIPKNKLSFLAMRDFIKSNYNSSEFKWDKLIIENKCIAKPGEKPKESHEIELNPTQKFITNFFCPESPYKGLLLWHSVGTGKTCTGVATASMSFEQQDYSILWVTRTTLKSDVWKNIFDQICHIVLKEEVKMGKILPDKLNDRKKILSKNWLEPMSYKQFSNLLEGKNKIYDILKERNGSEDILKKTLIIIDEAHKLYGGDLKATERPNTNVMEKLIMNSYKKSGPNSCKLLIMTATPFTDSPLELFSLTNLFFTNESEKITTNKEEFKKQYMTSENILSENGVKNLANKLSGYISYLNREKDPTQFAQPIMINVPVLMTIVDDEEIRDLLYYEKNIESMDAEVLKKIKILKEEIKATKTEVKEKKILVKETKNNAYNNPSEYEALKNDIKVLLENINNMEEELDNLSNKKDLNKELNKNLKQKLKTIRSSLIQEYMLYKKCLHLNYKKPNNISKQSSNKSDNKNKNKNKTKKYKKAENKSDTYKSFSN